MWNQRFLWLSVSLGLFMSWSAAAAAPLQEAQPSQRLTPWPSQPNLSFGTALAASSDTLAVGAVRAAPHRGEVYLFRRQGGSWVPQQKLPSPDTRSIGADQFGVSVALSGDTLAVGAETAGFCTATPPAPSGVGAVHVFVRGPTGRWEWQQTLCENETLSYGHRVALFGDALLVGTLTSDRAFVYRRNGETWHREKTLVSRVPPDPSLHPTDFGAAVAIWGDTALVGEPGDSQGNRRHTGAVNVFVRQDGDWAFRQKITVSEGDAELGTALAMSHDLAVAGAPNRRAGALSFVRGVFPWQGMDLQPSEPSEGSHFGSAAALAGSLLAVGTDLGKAYLFAHQSAAWEELDEIMLENEDPDDTFFGRAVAVLGDTVFVGAPRADQQAGAVYVYPIDLPQADLAVESRGGEGPLHIGDTVDFTVKILNRGPQAASHVVLAAGLGGGLQLVSATVGQSPCDLDSTLCHVGALAPDGEATVTYRARATLPGLWSSRFQATADEVDLEPANDAAVSSVRVVYPIAIRLDPPHQFLLAGEAASFTVTLANQARVDLTDLTVTDGEVPSCSGNLTHLAAARQARWECTLSGVTAGVTQTARVSAKLPDGSTVEASATAEVTVDVDSDGDGVPDGAEDLAPAQGDGNGDGMRDADQPNVTSLPGPQDDATIVTLATSGCGQNRKVRMLEPWALGSGGLDHRLGIVGFELPCEAATVAITFHGNRHWENVTWDSYGPLSYPGSPIWLASTPPLLGAAGETVTVAFADAHLGDQTGDDGRIVIQGAPGFPTPVPALSAPALLLFAGFLLSAGFRALRRR
jgi:uncharacterized repeat protein (TIGR01451 family)